MSHPSQVTKNASWPTFEPIGILAAGMLSFIGWTLYIGRDLNWDFLNYHLYLGLNAAGQRLATDFFPASSSSYLTPYAYWPLATMVAAGWPAMAVGSVMAGIHSLAVIATWYVAKQLFPDESRKALLCRSAATMLGVISPLVLTEVGSSFIDITSAIPGVFGIALFLKALGSERHRALFFVMAGVGFGLAAALKLTNAPFVLSAFLSLAVLCLFRPELNWRVLIVFGGAEAAGFAVGYGIWGFLLWREFGNPFFPLFNSLFQSSGSPASGGELPQQLLAPSMWERMWNIRSALHQRFLPINLWDWLLRPLYMVDPVANVYAEVRSPDARFLALFCLAPFALWKLHGRLRSNNLVALLIIFLFGWILWMATSGNGRYGMPLLLVAGPALVGCASVCWPRQSLAGLLAMSIFVCVQAALMWGGTKFRYDEVPWQGQWISAELPPDITDRPITFVTFDLRSVSWLSAFVHPKSRFANPVGLSAIPTAGPGSDRLSRLLAESAEIVVVFRYEFVETKTGTPFPPSPAPKDASVRQNGLLVDFDSCETGKLSDTGNIGTAVFVRNGERIERKGVRGFFFCRALYRPELRNRVPLIPAYETVFNLIEDACPRLFPPRSTTICEASSCRRSYSSTDAEVTINGDGEINSRHYSAFDDPFLGTVDKLTKDPSKIFCHNDLGRYVPWSPGANMFSRPPPAKQ
jgi:hypothetical protein